MKTERPATTVVKKLCINWRGWPFVAAALLLAVYGVTLSRGAYPGASAEAVARALNLTGEPLLAHPLWALLTRGVGTFAGRHAVVALNLFNACCAALAAVFFGHLLTHWLYYILHARQYREPYLLHPDEEEGEWTERERAKPLPASIISCPLIDAGSANALIARVGGWTATAALAFSMPYWSASTRLYAHVFDVLLLVITLWALLMHRLNPSLVWALVVASLCGLGCVESHVFVVASPVFYLILLGNRLQAQENWERQMALSMVLSVGGAVVGLLLLNGLRASDLPGLPALQATLLSLLRHHAAQIVAAWPGIGWIWSLFFIVVPLVVMVYAGSHFLAQWSISNVILHVILTTGSAFCLLNRSFWHWQRAEALDRLPVMASVAVAAVAGYLVSYWCRWGFVRDAEVAVEEKPEEEEAVVAHTDIGGLTARWMGRILGCGLVAVIAFAVYLNAALADGRKGAFTDVFAGHVLDRLGQESWVVSNGMLDHHLQVLARARGRNLRLVSFAQTYGENTRATKQIRLVIAADPSLADDRSRLYTAAALGPMSLARELLQTPVVGPARLLSVGLPEVWAMAGYRPVPVGFCFSGSLDLHSLPLAEVMQANQDFWEQAVALLAPSDLRLPVMVGRFRAVMRREAGRSATLFGVLLEDLADAEAAFSAYAAARRIDPQNLSALLNQYALAIGGTQADARPLLERDLQTRLRHEKARPPVEVIVRTYGEIRQPGILLQYGRAWSGVGQPDLARFELQRAKALAPADVGVNRQLAAFAMRQSDDVTGAAAYQAVLAATPDDFLAMVGMASVALARGSLDEAQQWLDRASQAGAATAVLAVPQAAILRATDRSAEAVSLLRVATETRPDHLEAWALLAELLLAQGEVVEVEKRILPTMARFAGKKDHVLVHLVRAALYRTRQPANLTAARTSLVHALKLQPDLSAVWGDLLELSFALGDLTLRERDAAAALRMNPDHAFANYLLATVLLERGDLARAEDLFHRSLAVHPTAEAYNDLAETLRQRQRLEEAEQAVRQALARDERSYAAWDTLACVLRDRDRLAEAEEAAKHSLTLYSSDPRTYLTLAHIFLLQGRHTNARTVLRREILHVPDLPEEVVRERDALLARCEQ